MPKKKVRYYVKPYNEYQIPSAVQVLSGVKELYRRRRYPRNQVRLITLVMLSGCGLRRSELAGLNMEHVVLDDDRQYLDLPGSICKRGRPRIVPLWNGRLLPYIRAWAKMRRAMGAGPRDPFVCSLDAGRAGLRLRPPQIRVYAIGAMRTGGFLGSKRFTAHTLRHFFGTYAINHPRIGIVNVRDAMGHSSLAVTNRYVHPTPGGTAKVDLFDHVGADGEEGAAGCRVLA
jgi:integrase